MNQFAILAAIIVVPFAVIMMTSFTRISIILTFLKQALATSVPSAPIIVGLSLILTGYVMHPVIDEIHQNALTPYLRDSFPKEEKTKEEQFVEKAWPILREFMLTHTRERDLELFLDIGKIEATSDLSSLPWYTVMPAFLLSELRVAFMIGFLIFLPFLVVDLVVTSLLMSMGMFMLPPVLISFPFKLLLFVIVDGWRLIVEQVVTSYERVG